MPTRFSPLLSLVLHLHLLGWFVIMITTGTVQARPTRAPPLNGLTPKEKVEMLYVFNKARAQTVVKAANMKKMSWDDDIANEMQAYVSKCSFGMPTRHPTMRPTNIIGRILQEGDGDADDRRVIAWSSSSSGRDLRGSPFAYRDRAYDPVGVALWRTWRMAPYYDFETGRCIDTPKSREICRHPDNYENIVLSGNERVGCGKFVCGPGPKGVHHACSVAGSGYVSPHAWTPGDRCSKCPAKWPHCDHGLCSRTPSLNGTEGDWWNLRLKQRNP